MATVVFLLNLCVYVLGVAPIPLEEIETGVEEHFARYDLHEFVYRVKRKNPQGEFEERINTYRLHLPTQGFPIRSLIETLPCEEEYPLDRFVIFDGSQQSLFIRGDLLKGRRSTARVVAFNDPYEFLCDKFVYLLEMSAAGVPFTLMDAHSRGELWNDLKDLLQFDSIQTLDGHNVFVFKAVVRGNEFKLRILEPPSMMVVGMNLTNPSSGAVYLDSTVEAIGKFGDLAYPKRGKIRMSHSLVISDNVKFEGVDYEFEVLEVRLLERFSQNDWQPAIPPGTSVANDITGEVFTIPFSDRQKEMIIANTESYMASLQRPVWGLYLRVTLVLVGLILIVYSICRLILKHKK